MFFGMPFSTATWRDYAHSCGELCHDEACNECFWSAQTTPHPCVYVSSHQLLLQTDNLRKRVLARLLTRLTPADHGPLTHNLLIKFAHETWAPIGERRYKIIVDDLNIDEIYEGCLESDEVRAALSDIPFTHLTMRVNGNDEVKPWLQDLADIICWEAGQAAVARYYPRPVDVDPLMREHIEQVMTAMQREIDREQRYNDIQHMVRKRTVLLPELPWGRKVALAERRRWWFAKFGITPETWSTGTFSLWNVVDEDYPEGPTKYNFIG